MHMKKLLRFAPYLALILALGAPALSYAATSSASTTASAASYEYNRISEDFSIHSDTSIAVEELLTMLYNGSYHSMSRIIALATSTSVTDIKVLDGSTGVPLTYSPRELDATDPESWGKYTVLKTKAGREIEWWYNTPDHVHTWTLEYTLHGYVTLYPDHDEFDYSIFSGYGVPVGTVEAEVHLPGAVVDPQSNLFTTDKHDYYIDRPNAETFRFRVSDINAGEQLSILAGWQKGLVHPDVPLLSLFAAGIIRDAVVGIVLILIIVLATYLVRKRGALRASKKEVSL